MIKTVCTALITSLFTLLLVNAFDSKNDAGVDDSDGSTGAGGQTIQQQIWQLEDKLDNIESQNQSLISQLSNEKRARQQLAQQIKVLETGGRIDLANEAPGLSLTDQDTLEKPIELEELTPEQELVDAGFSLFQAQQILGLEDDVRQQIINARFEGNNADVREAYFEGQKSLLATLGEEGYEDYLEARGLPSSVEINGIADNSPAALAGLESGDEILSYGGERVYNLWDLRGATREGTEGEQVLVEVLRDGVQQSVVVPRGQLGITSDSGVRNNFRRFSRGAAPR